VVIGRDKTPRAHLRVHVNVRGGFPLEMTVEQGGVRLRLLLLWGDCEGVSKANRPADHEPTRGHRRRGKRSAEAAAGAGAG
jgi:hypothetical protein